MVNSRRVGHNFEREIVDDLRNLGYLNAKTTRNGSRADDVGGVDVQNTRPFSIQTKRTTNMPNFRKVLSAMPAESTTNINIIFQKNPHQGVIAVTSQRSMYLLMHVFKEWMRGK
jgi:hypothetical protein